MKKIITALFAFVTITSADIFSTPQSLQDVVSTYGGKSIEQILQDLNSANSLLNLLFSNHSIDSVVSDITGDNQLMQCIASGLDLSSIAGNIGSLGGLCDLLNMGDAGIGGFSLGDLAKCVGLNIPDMGLDSMSAFCSNQSPPSGSSLAEGGVVSSPNASNPNGWSYSAPIVSDTATIDLDGIAEESTEFKPVKVSDRTYASGKTGEELYSTDGGLLNKAAASNPTSGIAQSIKNFDKASLILSDIALKTLGTDDPSVMKLPATKKDAIDTEDSMANLLQAASTNFHDLIDSLVIELQNEFKTIEADTLAEYYQKEKEKFYAYVSANETLKGIYTASAKAIKLKYANKVLLQTQDATYIDDPSEARAALLEDNQKITFRYAALLQQYKNVDLKTALALELKQNKQKIDIAVRQAYVRASLFREDIAKKELDQMLRAVDTLIR